MSEHRNAKGAIGWLVVALSFGLFIAVIVPSQAGAADEAVGVKSVRSGNWSDVKTWQPARVPGAGDKVLISAGTRVVYDVESDKALLGVQVSGILSFARDRNTSLTVGVLKVARQRGEDSATGVEDVDKHAHHDPAEISPDGPALEVGTADQPIPRPYTARIRLKYFDGMDKTKAPAIVCRPGARMEFHGAPMSRTWVDLGADVRTGDTTVTLSQAVKGWRVSDEIIITASKHEYVPGSFRNAPDHLGTERRRIKAMNGVAITLDKPVSGAHSGSGKYRSEVANLTRTVVVESADPKGVRGHTMYHRFSAGSISYARFAHLGKESTLGRYSIHFHRVGDTLRGSSVIGAAIIDSHNRWITIHATQYMVVRDCVGFGSVGHGFFLEDGTEVYNVLDRNLGIQAYEGKRMRNQALPFDPNDGAAFWWANGKNTFVRNVSCQNDKYGYRYDSQKRSNFDSNLPIRQADGSEKIVDIRTIPIYRFQDNESHSEGLYSFVFAGTDGVGPDTKHPHMIKNLTIWQTHYALRTQLPTMLVENVSIDHAAYGVYRPRFDNHVYRNLYMNEVGAEPFNRGLDDQSEQQGVITVDGLTFAGRRYGRGMPFIQMSDNNVTGRAESHFRHVTAPDPGKEPYQRNVKPLVNRGGGRVVPPVTPRGVPVYIHDYYGKGRDAKIVCTKAKDFGDDGLDYKSDYPLTGREAVVAEVHNVQWPKLLDPVDDEPPATVITYPTRGTMVKLHHGALIVRGTTTDNIKTARVIVNGVEATDVDYNFDQWRVKLTNLKPGKLVIKALAVDAAGNKEQTPHELTVMVR